ncbi:hypothetical protein [Xylella phage Cota]|uniref:Uncharacterized protein n=1 Tax=Xylella phage Cota TaxID=2699877 RepID=A0A6F8ZKT7_9CAUD|nr:hypothetical protein [Xylella phage Cota]
MSRDLTNITAHYHGAVVVAMLHSHRPTDSKLLCMWQELVVFDANFHCFTSL